MDQLQNYKNQNVFSGFSRIDLLLEIYDCAIESFKQAKISLAENQADAYNQHFLKGQKAILAIHAGLKPDEHDVAFNVARLLHFVLQRIEQQEFDDAIKVLSSLRTGLGEIQTEANQLEQSGQIPSMPSGDSFVASA